MKKFFVVPTNEKCFHFICEEGKLDSILREHNVTEYTSVEVPLHNTFEKYREFLKNNSNLNEEQFFEKLKQEFRLSDAVFMDIWYCPQRSWFKPIMAEVIMIMDQEPNHPVYNFKPMFTLGEHKWNGYKFVELS